VLTHPEFKDQLLNQAGRAAKRRKATQETEDIQQEAQAFIRTFLRAEPADVEEEYWHRLWDKLHANPNFIVQVSPDRPLPQAVTNEIYNLCLNLTPRQRKSTPRLFRKQEDQQIVHQGLRGRPGDRRSEDPPDLLTEAEEQAELDLRKKRLWAAAECTLDEISHSMLKARSCGSKLAEIGEAFSVTESAVSQRLSRAMKEIRIYLGDCDGSTS
jgi:DNA-directed RNA polymerase specialized sigma24 family protein